MSKQEAAELLVFYNKKQTSTENTGYSPSAKKPKLVVQAWRQLGYPVRTLKIRALSVEEIAVAHDKNYVKGILSGKLKNGFGTTSLKVAQSLPWTTGSFFGAALHAYQHRVSTFSPTSGFHHAGYSYANGFCTFNGLAIAALLLKKHHKAHKIGILDLDSHAGDGTDQILYKTNSAAFIPHYSLGYHEVQAYNNAAWLEQLPALIEQHFGDCDLLLYQAGVDCHQNDPEVYSGYFTTEQLYTRDRLVYATCRALGLPVVTNLAGGYQKPLQKVVDLHRLTARAFLEVYET